MDDDIFNALNWDSYLLADKLNIPAVYRKDKNQNNQANLSNRSNLPNYSNADKYNDSNSNLLELNKEIQAELYRQKNQKESMCNCKKNCNCNRGMCNQNGCNCSGVYNKTSENMHNSSMQKSNTLDSSVQNSNVQDSSKILEKYDFINKILIMLVFILGGFCIIQFINQRKTEDLIISLVKNMQFSTFDKSITGRPEAAFGKTVEAKPETTEGNPAT